MSLVLLLIWVAMPKLIVWWPPRWLELRRQRQTFEERVKAAGGWAAIQRDCDALVEQHPNIPFLWSRHNTNVLPPALATLKPQSMSFYPPSISIESNGKDQAAVVHIKVFGMHSTGGHSTPYFGLEVVSGADSNNYAPVTSQGGISANRHRSYRKVTESIYETY
jgi:hypothetical protein